MKIQLCHLPIKTISLSHYKVKLVAVVNNNLVVKGTIRTD
jgi:hypothetical protein